MDQKEKIHVKNPREKANLISIITFGWLFKTFLNGYKRNLEIGDIFSPLKEHSSTFLGDRMEEIWNREKRRKDKKKSNSPPSLFKALVICFGKWITIIGICQGFWEFILRIYQPLILAKLLRFLSGNDVEEKANIYLWALGFIVCCFIDVYMQHFTMQGLMHLGLKIRVACTTLIYRKILRLSHSVFDNGTSIGQMVNLINTDVNRLDYMLYSVHYLWIGPIQTVIIAYFVWQEIGWPAIVGMLTFLIFIPIQALIGKQFSKLTHMSAYRTDNRLRLMNEIIAGIEVIKMYVWEKPFSLLIEKARRKEISAIKKFSIYEAITFTFDLYIPRLCLFVTILPYIFTGNHINAEKVYMVAAYYGVLRLSMTVNFPMAVGELVEGLVSIKRLRQFMIQPEIEKTPDTSTEKGCSSSTVAISLQNLTAKWSANATSDTLSDVNLSVKYGRLVAVVGQVGAGKSSLLHAILRELPLTSGSLERNGKIAYASQMPWIFASTVRQNILFGKSMNQARYERTLQVCQLKPDIATFSHGDMTVVGPRGISLSGGQRARINLARAIYAEADIYLLDDPLSAVDSHVGRLIVDDCICGLLKGKTRVLVTHQLQYLREADLVVVINNGRIEMQGSYDDISAAGIDLTKFIEPVNEKSTSPTEIKDSPNFNVNGDGAKLEMANGDAPMKNPQENETNAVEEDMQTGSISGDVYFSYLKAVRNNFLVLLTFLAMVLSQAVASGGDYFVAFWVNVEESSIIVTENGNRTFVWQGTFSRELFVYVYSITIVATIVLCLQQVFLCFSAFMRASRNLHNDMFRSITRTKMIFFNENPSGRVLNRFSKDMFAIDRRLPPALIDVTLVLIILFMTLTIIGVVNPWLLLPVVVLAVVFYYLRLFYVRTSRSIKRLEGVTRSPVNDHVTVTLQGLTTVRAFEAQDILSLEFDTNHDVNTSAYYMFQTTSRAFGMYIHLCCTIYIALITYVFLIFEDFAYAADVGLILTQGINFMGFLQWGMRQTTELENTMTSVERVLHYSRLEEEPHLEGNSQKKPAKEWPTSGHIAFKNVRLKYNPNGGYILKDLTLEIKPREKIGIVGRTGAGKTSLISALFRLAIVEGDILIDGISTASIGLHDFRSKISIIPQEPVLFAGTLRQNLDPFEEFHDDVLWSALEEVELKEIVTAMEAGLNVKVSEGGSNFSVGQRQLLCLARAVIRNNKIMVLDEATANVDPLTDSLIQATVRKKFKDCTVLTVAHRLHTIMDSDRVLVMNAGRSVEFDSPYKLLRNKDIFYSMVQQTGSAMAATLTKIAEDTYFSKNNSNAT